MMKQSIKYPPPKKEPEKSWFDKRFEEMIEDSKKEQEQLQSKNV